MHKHILAKTTTYGFGHMFVAFLVALIVTHDAHIALGISLLEPLFQIVFFAFHEYVWQKYHPGTPIQKDACCGGVTFLSKLMKKKEAE